MLGVLNDNQSSVILVINTKKLQFIHSVDGDTSKTAKIIAITLPECQRDAQ